MASLKVNSDLGLVSGFPKIAPQVSPSFTNGKAQFTPDWQKMSKR